MPIVLLSPPPCRRYEYDGLDRVKKLIDARTHEYSFDYDLAGRKTRMTYPDTSYEQWTYNHAGQVTTYRTRAGQVRTCGYDQRNRDLTCDWSDTTPDVVKTYDLAGRLLTMNNGVSNLAFTYDHANQLLSETQTILASGMGAKTVAYTYDADGNRASLTSPDGSVTGYTYTARNQVRDITDGAPPPLARFTYDLAGRRLTKNLELDAAGVGLTNTAYSYNSAGHLTKIWHKRATGQSINLLNYTVSGFDAVQTAMTWNYAGVTWTDSASYDGILQLTGGSLSSSTGATGAQHSYTYDEVGNRLTVNDPAAGPTSPTQRQQTALPANNLNQYTQILQSSPNGPVTLSFTYDTNGNLATGPAAWDQSGDTGSLVNWTYTYDAQNRLTQAVSATTGVTVTLAYDARNRCVSRTVNGTAAYLLYDEWNVLEDRAADGSPVARYVHGPNVDEILCKITAGGPVYYHEDRLGSIIALTNASGTVVERYAYTGFGQCEIRNAAGTLLAESGYGNRFRFTGREWVSTLGLYDYRNRAYSLNLGRFLQTDPILFAGEDENLFRYVWNNPVGHADPSGLAPTLSIKIGCALACGLTVGECPILALICFELCVDRGEKAWDQTYGPDKK